MLCFAKSILLLLSTALQLLMQSFGLLNHFFPSFFYPGQRSSILAHSFSVNIFWHRPPNVSLVFPLALLIWVSRSVFVLTILASCILSIWPYHPNLCALAKFIMFLCFIIFIQFLIGFYSPYSIFIIWAVYFSQTFPFKDHQSTDYCSFQYPCFTCICDDWSDYWEM